MTTPLVEYIDVYTRPDIAAMSLADQIRAQQAADRAAGIRYTFAPSTPAVDALIAAILGTDDDPDLDDDDDLWEDA